MKQRVQQNPANAEDDKANETQAKNRKSRVYSPANNAQPKIDGEAPNRGHNTKRKGQAAPYEQHASDEQTERVTEPGTITRQRRGRIIDIGDKSKLGALPLRHDHSPFLALVRTALVAGAAGVSA